MFEGFKLTTIDTGEATDPPAPRRQRPAAPAAARQPADPRDVAQDRAPAGRGVHGGAADIRGYGDSTKPPYTDDHAPYSKRAMARDQVEVMRQLGFEQFFVAGPRPRRAGRVPAGARSPGARPEARRRSTSSRPTRRTAGATWTCALAPGTGTSSAAAGRLPRAGDQQGARGLLRAPPDQHLDARGPRRLLALLPEPGHHPRHLRGLPRRHHRGLQGRRGGLRQEEDHLPDAGALGRRR